MLDSSLLPLAAALFVATSLLYILYSGVTGPLAHLPGPVWTKFTGAEVTYHILRGVRMYYLHDLHRKYGPVVRINPTEVSVSSPEAAKEIHKPRGGFLKTKFYEDFAFGPTQTIFTTSDPSYHAKWRRLLANPMSESNLKSLEPIVQAKLDLMISQVQREKAAQGYVDLLKWVTFFTIDVMADLSFGESFQMLEKGENNQYIQDTRTFVPLNVLRASFTSSPNATTKDLPIWPFTSLTKMGDRLTKNARDLMEGHRKQCVDAEKQRPMLLDNLLGQKGVDAGATEAEIVSHAQIIMLAGTDTTGITLIYLLWVIFDHPNVLSKLLKEFEDAQLPEVPDNDQIRRLPYLDNVISETRRLYGSAPGPLPRRVPKGGREICGYFVPEGLTASPCGYSIHRDERLFPDPDTWNPDRWANATKDMREADVSFGKGTRVCLGMHLAMMQIRLATVAILRTFSESKLAYGQDGFCPEDMRQFDALAAKPWKERMLIK